MEELFHLVSEKIEQCDISVCEDMQRIRESIIDESLNQKEIVQMIESNATNLWNKSVTLSRNIAKLSEEQQNLAKNQIIPNIRILCCDIFHKYSSTNYEKQFRCGVSTCNTLYEACRYEECNHYFDLCISCVNNINLELPYNLQSIVQLHICHSRSLIATFDPDSALRSLKDMTQRIPIASSSLSSYILQTADSLKSPDWSSFCIEFFSKITELSDAFLVDAIILHFSILSSLGNEAKIDINLNLDEQAKEFIDLAQGIFNGTLNIEHIMNYTNEANFSRLAKICCINIKKLPPDIFPFIISAATRDTDLKKYITRAAIEINSFELISKMNLDESDFSPVWNHSIALKSSRNFAEAAQWCSLLIGKSNDDAKLFRFQSRCFSEVGEHQHAIELAKEATERSNDDASKLTYFKALVKASEYDKASEFASSFSNAESIVYASSIFANESRYSDCLNLIKKAFIYEITGEILKIVAFCLQRIELNNPVTKEAIKELSSKHIDFKDVDDDVRRAICIAVYNNCRNDVNCLLMALHASCEEDTTDALSYSFLKATVFEQDEKILEKILEIQTNDEITNCCNAINSIFFGQQNDPIELIKQLNEKSINFILRLLSTATVHVNASFLLQLLSIDSLSEEAISHITLIVFKLRFTHDEMRELCESLSNKFDDRFSASLLEYFCCSCWNYGRDGVGIYKDSEWFLSLAINTASRHEELSLLRDHIVSVYNEYLSS